MSNQLEENVKSTILDDLPLRVNELKKQLKKSTVEIGNKIINLRHMEQIEFFYITIDKVEKVTESEYKATVARIDFADYFYEIIAKYFTDGETLFFNDFEAVRKFFVK